MRRDDDGQERLLPPKGLSYSNAAVLRQYTHSSNIHVDLESGKSRFCSAGTTIVFGAQKIRNLTHCSGGINWSFRRNCLCRGGRGESKL
jgi:hypothetical protein